MNITLTPDPGASTYTAALPTATTFINGAVSNKGQTFTFNTLQAGGNIFHPTGGAQLTVSSGALSFTLTQTSAQGGQGTGTISGNLTITGTGLLGGSNITVSGPISGTYTATLK
jgi:hypothetical protein